MLPPFIIDQIRKREEERRHHEMPRLDLPIPMDPRPAHRTVPDDDVDRGVVIVELG